jgi:hypothetical protein
MGAYEVFHAIGTLGGKEGADDKIGIVLYENKMERGRTKTCYGRTKIDYWRAKWILALEKVKKEPLEK